MSCKSNNAVNPAVVSGVGLIVVGVLLLLSQMGLIHDWFNFWAAVFVVAGTLNLVQTGKTRVWGFLLVWVGVLLELDQLGIVHIRIQTYWPMLVIAAGGVMLWYAFHPPDETGAASSPHLNVVAIWGGGEYRILAKNFRGGELVAFMGGFDVDLRDADIDGDQAVITVNALMGGGVIRVPENWAVSMRVAAFMGGHSMKARERVPPNKTLVIKGLAIMGGVEVRN